MELNPYRIKIKEIGDQVDITLPTLKSLISTLKISISEKGIREDFRLGKPRINILGKDRVNDSDTKSLLGNTSKRIIGYKSI